MKVKAIKIIEEDYNPFKGGVIINEDGRLYLHFPKSGEVSPFYFTEIEDARRVLNGVAAPLVDAEDFMASIYSNLLNSQTEYLAIQPTERMTFRCEEGLHKVKVGGVFAPYFLINTRDVKTLVSMRDKEVLKSLLVSLNLKEGKYLFTLSTNDLHAPCEHLFVDDDNHHLRYDWYYMMEGGSLHKYDYGDVPQDVEILFAVEEDTASSNPHSKINLRGYSFDVFVNTRVIIPEDLFSGKSWLSKEEILPLLRKIAGI